MSNRDEKGMVGNDYESLIGFIKSAELKCAYVLVILFSAIKLRDEGGNFPKEKVLDFFISFYRTREKYKLASTKECNPLQTEDRNDLMKLISETPIITLLNEGLFITPESFNSDLLGILFDNETDILSAISTRIIEYYLETLRNADLTLTLFPDEMGKVFLQDLIIEFLAEWEDKMNDYIKIDASKRLAEFVDKIQLEFLLKFLFQSYSLKSMNILLQQFRMTREQLENYFSGEIDYAKLPIAEPVKSFIHTPSPATIAAPSTESDSAAQNGNRTGSQYTDSSQISASVSASEKKMQALTNLFQQMQETDVEEDYYETKQKALEESQRALEGEPKKKKGRFGKFKKLFKK